MLHFLGAAFHGRAGFFAHHACEKYLKAVQVQSLSGYLETHRLLTLSKKCSEVDCLFAERTTTDTLQRFDHFEQLGRYGAHTKMDPLAINTPEIQTAGVVDWGDTDLQHLDAFVFKARGLLDWKAAHYDDGLNSILTGNQNSRFLSSWHGEQELSVILTKENSYFTRKE